MLIDKDYIHSEKIPNSAPMAYIMKGKSLPADDLCFIVNDCRKELHKCQIPILCEIYDGQWWNIVMYDNSGQPLNCLQLAKVTWDCIGKLSKDKIIEDLINCSKMFPGDKDLLMLMNTFKNGTTTLSNIEIEKHSTCQLVIKCLGGQIYPRSIMPYIRTVENDDMWTNPNLFGKEPSVRPKKQCKPISLKSCESSIMDLLDATVTTVADPTPHSSEVLHADDCLPHLHVDLKERITESEFSLVQDIVTELQNTNKDKWSNLIHNKCYTEILKNSKNMMKCCTLSHLVCLLHNGIAHRMAMVQFKIQQKHQCQQHY